MDFYDFAHLINSGEETCKEFLQANGLIRNNPPACPHPQCIAANRRMDLAPNRPGRQEQFRWRCWIHKTELGIRSGSFFESTQLEFTKIVGMLHYWSFEIGVKTSAALLGLPERTVIRWNKVRFVDLCAEADKFEPSEPSSFSSKSPIRHVLLGKHNRI